MTAPAADGDPPRRIGLVLAGGGARGAYEMGVLRELLPWLAKQLKPEDGWPADIDPRTWRPDIIVGTSVGALNAAYLAATAHEDPLPDTLHQGCDIWREITWGKALADLLSPKGGKAMGSAILDFFDFPGVHARKLFDPSPLAETLTNGPLSKSRPDGIPFDEIHENVHNRKRIEAAAVVATRASTSLTQVFYDGRGKVPTNDLRRGINYAPTGLGVDHVRASAAIPSAFPAVWVEGPRDVRAWYYDGGTRLNTPIKPAIDLGATHLIVVALHSLSLGDVLDEDLEPELLDGAKQLIQGLLVDPLVNDLHTLAEINTLVGTQKDRRIHVAADPPGRPDDKTYREIPYIVVAPGVRAIGQCAVDTYKEHDHKLLDNVAILHRGLDVDNESSRGELFSYLYFDEHFGSALVDLGWQDATKLINRIEGGELPLWQTGPPA